MIITYDNANICCFERDACASRWNLKMKFILRSTKVLSLIFLMLTANLNSQNKLYLNQNKECVYISHDTIFYILIPKDQCINFPLIGKAVYQKLSQDTLRQPYQYKTIKQLYVHEIIQVTKTSLGNGEVEFIFTSNPPLLSSGSKIEILNKNYKETLKNKLVVQKNMCRLGFVYLPRIKYEKTKHINKKYIYYTSYLDGHRFLLNNKVSKKIINDSVVIRYYSFGFNIEWGLFIQPGYKYIFNKKIKSDFVNHREDIFFNIHNDTIIVSFRDNYSVLFLNRDDKKDINTILKNY